MMMDPNGMSILRDKKGRYIAIKHALGRDGNDGGDNGGDGNHDLSCFMGHLMHAFGHV